MGLEWGQGQGQGLDVLDVLGVLVVLAPVVEVLDQEVPRAPAGNKAKDNW